ncbi:cyclopropane-fatty-acyl-phospholipid synthase family protein [Marinimicrobium sp. ABcell2]|uniref:SAM-dependent methyltransferase n=1 Tax=Marinimicrobium sp. ABcell2 TaxID=3069751 RepID=UPI0027B46C69|nr:cyclopropane-fatty-acyl-phospholipid synthase family protein [Marinimicrobium sp. ABcell2]MDQ2076798.1 cyclopropane-fatty-acyl-phospholipid synthase family protein [Marinimicrobium sp. ABcell2]
MKTIDYKAERFKHTSGDGLTAYWAKKIMLPMLERIAVGRLTLSDGDQTWHFGKPDCASGIQARIRVHHASAYRQVLLGGTIGSGEAYMAGAWSSPDLLAVIRLFVANQALLEKMDSRWSWLANRGLSLLEAVTPNTVSNSKKHIVSHYDLSNDFFELFLDPQMMYSSAIYQSDDTSLETAAVYKLDHICQRLKLNSDDHLLEIGSGWGGLAIHAAKHYGCTVTTTTISDQQFNYAQARIAREGLQGKIQLLKKDYRLLEGQYDKLVSIEMVEAVGHQYYGEFFNKCSSLLKPSGLMLMQAITTADQRFDREKRNIDFIRRYIFPGGCLPSNAEILSTTASATDMHLVGLEDITQDYAQTLRDWRKRFFDRLDAVKGMGYSESFIRMWEFYLCYCEGGFRERMVNTAQFLFAKPHNRDRYL